MIAKVFLCLAVLLEAIAFPFILFTTVSHGEWVGLLVLHLLLSFAIGLLGRDSLPEQYQHPAVMGIVFFSAFSLFIPMLGAIGVLSIVLMTKYFHTTVDKPVFQELGDSRLGAGQRVDAVQFDSGDLQGRFMSTRVDTESRLDALGKLQGFETHQVSATVKGALQDQADDIRLVAFGILDKKEKAINSRIHRELESFHQAIPMADKVGHARDLAYGYWELVYKEVVDGDILTYVLEQVKHFNDFVLAEEPADAGMWALNGQIHLRAQNITQARGAFTKALEHGIPETRVTPYLGELAFRQKDFLVLPELFRRSQTLSEISILTPLLKYWSVEPVDQQIARVQDLETNVV